VPAVHHHRHARLSQQPPGRVEQRVTRVEITHLHVHLGAPGTPTQRPLQVFGNARLGVERRGGHGRLHGRGEVGDPTVEPVRHPRFVRVDQRREHPHIQRAQHRHAIILRQPVVHGPRLAVLRGGLVEKRPHLDHHPLGQEMHVQVNQAVQTQRRSPRRDVGVIGR
jgi:hypothetical protein